MNKLLLCTCIGLSLALSSCAEISTDYASTDPNSLNGINVLHDQWSKAFNLRVHRNRSERLEDTDLLIHVVRDYQFRLTKPMPEIKHKAQPGLQPAEHTDADLEADTEIDIEDFHFEQNADFSNWLEEWLQQGQHKQFVLILRDGNIAPQLCEEWALDFEQAAKHSSVDSEQRDFLKQAELLRTLAQENISPPLAAMGEHLDYHWFQVHGRPHLSMEAITGIYNDQAPHTFFSRSSLSADNGETLLTVAERTYALAIPVGDNRLIVVANATPLLDAALVDPHARALLESLTTTINEWKPESGAWLQSLSSSSGNPPPPQNILKMLFTKEPFNYVIIHALVLLLFFLFWRACWLGRRQSQRKAVEEEFDRHIDALAFHLRHGKEPAKHYAAIAQYLGKPATELSIETDADAIEQLQHLYTQSENKG